MKTGLLLGLVTALLCLFTTALIESWWVTVTAEMAVGATVVAVWAVRWARQERARLVRVSALLQAAYAAGATVVPLRALTPLVDDRDLNVARTEARTAEANLLAQRYANGEHSER